MLTQNKKKLLKRGDVIFGNKKSSHDVKNLTITEMKLITFRAYHLRFTISHRENVKYIFKVILFNQKITDISKRRSFTCLVVIIGVRIFQKNEQ